MRDIINSLPLQLFQHISGQ